MQKSSNTVRQNHGVATVKICYAHKEHRKIEGSGRGFCEILLSAPAISLQNCRGPTSQPIPSEDADTAGLREGPGKHLQRRLGPRTVCFGWNGPKPWAQRKWREACKKTKKRPSGLKSQVLCWMSGARGLHA